MKYNPGFLPDYALVESFCVRLAELESLLETLRETKGSSNVHRLVIGPRGSGKTTLMLRVVAEVRRDPGLSAQFFPLVLPEENYEASTCGEFWLACVAQLVAKAPPEGNGIDLRLSYEELRDVQPDRDLADRCLATLVDFARRAGKRLLVIAENLNAFFEEMSDADAGWRLRKVLQTEPRIMLFASATSRFNEIDHPEHALYNFFETLVLRRLQTWECAALWERVSGKRTSEKEIRPIEILTGGSPRLIAIVAQFGGGLSFERLLDELMRLVDDHTEYFKRHIEALPAQERRVYLALAEIWKPATTREVARRARLQTSHCSAHLKRLAGRGAVIETAGTARRKQYYLAERLYNIYYLVRKRGGPAALVEALVRFMASYYCVRELIGGWASIAKESVGSDSANQPLVADGIARLVEILPGHRAELLDRLPESFIKSAGESTLWRYKAPVLGAAQSVPRTGRESAGLGLATPAELESLVQDMDSSFSASEHGKAAKVCDEIIARFGSRREDRVRTVLAGAWLKKGVILASSGHMGEALHCFRRAAECSVNDSDLGMALVNQGLALASLQKPDEAVTPFDEVVARFLRRDSPELLELVAAALFNEGVAFRDLGLTDDAIRAWDQTVRLIERCNTPGIADRAFKSGLNKATTQCELEQYEDALASYERVTAVMASCESLSSNRAYMARLLMNKASALLHVSSFQRALDTSEQSLNELNGEISGPESRELRAGALSIRGSALEGLGRDEEAIEAYSNIIRQYGNSTDQALVGRVVEAVVNKSQVLAASGRLTDALREYDAIEQWVRDGGPTSLARDLEVANLNRAALSIKIGAPDQAIAIADGVLGHRSSDSARNRVRAHWIRAEARYASGDTNSCRSDIENALVSLPENDASLHLAINQLVLFAARLGIGQVLAIIEGSASRDLLLPLTTALAQELGRKPRVSKEVAEVANDIRHDIARVRGSTA